MYSPKRSIRSNWADDKSNDHAISPMWAGECFNIMSPDKEKMPYCKTNQTDSGNVNVTRTYTGLYSINVY